MDTPRMVHKCKRIDNAAPRSRSLKASDIKSINHLRIYPLIVSFANAADVKITEIHLMLYLLYLEMRFIKFDDKLMDLVKLN